MIFDSLANASSYYGLHDRFKTAFEWLAKTDVHALEPGKYDIQGKDVWVNLTRVETKLPKDGKWEAHKKYADIQVVIDGEDTMHWARLDQVKLGAYNAEKDFQELNADTKTELVVKAGEFAVFLPTDAHKPGLSNKAGTKVLKAVLKVRVDDLA